MARRDGMAMGGGMAMGRMGKGRRPKGAGSDEGADDEGPNMVLHETIHEIVERQLASGEPPEAREALERLQSEGLDRHEAVHLIGAALAKEIFDTLKGGAHDPARYAARLRGLGPCGGGGREGADGGERERKDGEEEEGDAPSTLDLLRPGDFIPRGRRGRRLDWFTYELARGILLGVPDLAQRAVERHRLTGEELVRFAAGMARRIVRDAVRELAGDGPRMEVTDVMAMELLPWIDPDAAWDLAQAAGGAWKQQLDMCAGCPNACLTNADEPWDGREM